MIVGEGQEYLAALLTLNTMMDDRTGQPTNVLTEDSQRWFRHARFKVQTVEEAIEELDSGLQLVIQAGIDRVNQLAMCPSHMIADWRIMPNQWRYEVNFGSSLAWPSCKIDAFYLTLLNRKGNWESPEN